MTSLLAATLAVALGAAAAPPRKPLDPCSLLDPKAIAAAQGAAPKATKASEQPAGALVAQQCFFTLPDFARSVSLEVQRAPDAAGRKALQERWELISGEEREREEREEKEQPKRDSKGKPGKADDDEGRTPPKVIKGVGRGAVWTGSAKAGALYVLGPGAIVRVSVGGAADEAGKIKACSALAKDALKHLAAAR